MNVIFGKILKLLNIFFILFYVILINCSFGRASQINHQNFQLQFLEPIDKSSFSIDDEIIINWDSEEGMGLNDPIKSIDIFYCLNKGYGCIKIANNVNFSENSFFWLIPDVPNERIYIKANLLISGKTVSTVPIEINIINNQNSVENNKPNNYVQEQVDPVNSKTINQHYFRDFDLGLYVSRDQLNNIRIKWNQQDSYVKIYAFDSERLIRSQKEIKKGHNVRGNYFYNNSAYIDLNKYTNTNKDLTIQIINHNKKTYDYKILAPISTSNNFTSSYKNKSEDWASEENKGEHLSLFAIFLLTFFSLIAGY